MSHVMRAENINIKGKIVGRKEKVMSINCRHLPPRENVITVVCMVIREGGLQKQETASNICLEDEHKPKSFNELGLSARFRESLHSSKHVVLTGSLSCNSYVR